MAVFNDPLAIGKITTAEQTFTIQRGDQTIELSQGDFIYLDDVISAGGTAVGIAFADETTMSVDPNSTMVIDDFVYDPENPTTGSMNANVLQGNFSFVSGQIAKVSGKSRLFDFNTRCHNTSPRLREYVSVALVGKLGFLANCKHKFSTS